MAKKVKLDRAKPKGRKWTHKKNKNKQEKRQYKKYQGQGRG